MAATTTLKLDEAIKNRVGRLAESRRRSAHWLMREAIREYVEREEARESFRQSAIAAWEEFQATGAHVTGDEADDWLARLQTGEEAPPPNALMPGDRSVCHLKPRPPP